MWMLLAWFDAKGSVLTWSSWSRIVFSVWIFDPMRWHLEVLILCILNTSQTGLKHRFWSRKSIFASSHGLCWPKLHPLTSLAPLGRCLQYILVASLLVHEDYLLMMCHADIWILEHIWSWESSFSNFHCIRKSVRVKCRNFSFLDFWDLHNRVSRH